MAEKPYNAADPAQVKKRERESVDATDLDRSALAKLLKLPEFRRFVWSLMHETCGLMQSPSSSNGSLQSHQIGRQDVGREIWAKIEAVDPLTIPEMMVEWHQAKKK